MSTDKIDGADSPKAVSHKNHWTDREGIIELTHNYGTENDPNYKTCNGNKDHGKGFGHVCISVDNIQAACKRISDAGYKFQKKLEVCNTFGYLNGKNADDPMSRTAVCTTLPSPLILMYVAVSISGI